MSAQDKIAGEIETLKYPACPGPTVTEWNGWAEAGDEAATGPARGAKSCGEIAGAACDENESASRAFELGRARGREEGRQAERDQIAATQGTDADRQKRQLAALVANFAGASDRYLQEVEQEVVKLALAIASRILRREAQMDPLLLTGAVRVALGQLTASSEMRLLVPAAELELWREAIAHVPHLASKPQVAAGEGMRLGDCKIESHVGTVDLGVRAQLAEIERGFFDRAGGETMAALGSQTIAPEAGA